MSRILAFGLMLGLAFALVGCYQENQENGEGSNILGPSPLIPDGYVGLFSKKKGVIVYCPKAYSTSLTSGNDCLNAQGLDKYGCNKKQSWQNNTCRNSN